MLAYWRAGRQLQNSHLRLRKSHCRPHRQKQALRWGAHSIYLAHNHPSGNPNPGPKDLERTRELSQVAILVDVKLRDHLALGDAAANGGKGFVSIRVLRPDLFD
ncbi:MAG: hypothetical protein IJQ73_02910 [Kiritimatiellae bacterium]|nr:hypothetical protein [Kiritimatiellia bacterium]